MRKQDYARLQLEAGKAVPRVGCSAGEVCVELAAQHADGTLFSGLVGYTAIGVKPYAVPQPPPRRKRVSKRARKASITAG